MQLKTSIVNTRDIPYTVIFLKNHLPGVLRTDCFNEGNLTFEEEVVATELGHLFEHILLETICSIKYSQGFSNAIYNGVTSWNWKKDPYGMFRISIDTGHEEEPLFHISINKTIELFEGLLNLSSSSVSVPLFALQS